MCDTFGIIGKNKIFGKNSDRSPNEIQVVEFIKRHKNKNKKVKLSYIEIDEVEEVNSILISRPKWLWGAEMGVNEHGLVIGNEAIFTSLKYEKIGLTGMDVVRLCLERCNSATEAVDFIKRIIKKYKMGGNCGYDHNFYYDNSYLIMDHNHIFIVETSKDKCIIKETTKANISNCLSLKSNIKENKIYKYFSKSSKRKKLVADKLTDNLNIKEAMDILRTHSNNKYLSGSVDSVCMHAGKLIGDHTTNSMIVELKEKEIVVYTTLGSLPCLSIYKKGVFGKDNFKVTNNYYINNELLKRKLFTKEIPDTFYKEKDLLEDKIINNKISFKDSLKYEKELYKNINNYKTISNIKSYWINKNKIFKEENHANS